MGNHQSGRGGLPPAMRREIIRRLTAGQEKNIHIARAVGVNVSTVQRIKRQLLRRPDLADDENATERCPCGALILMSGPGFCVSCWLRKTHFRAASRAKSVRPFVRR